MDTPQEFRDVPHGETFYRKSGRMVMVMVKVNDTQAVLINDAPDSMLDLPTYSFMIPPTELMIGKQAFESWEADHPSYVIRSANHPIFDWSR